MPKLIVSLDGVVVKEVHLSKSRSTIGRRPYNDVVIDNLAVSGEHAAITAIGSQVELEDLGSTNGTYVNGQAIRKQMLDYGDQIGIGRYEIQYLESTSPTADTLGVFSVGDGAVTGEADAFAAPADTAYRPPTLDGDAIEGPYVKVLNGVSAGRSMALTKVVTTIGKPGVSVASIAWRGHGFDLTHITGDQAATVNGISVADGPLALKQHDLIDVGGVALEFFEY